MVIKDSRCCIKVFLRNAVVPNQIGPEERTEVINRMERLMAVAAWEQGYYFKETNMLVVDRGENGTEYAVLGIGFPRRRDILFLDPAEYGHGAW